MKRINMESELLSSQWFIANILQVASQKLWSHHSIIF